MHLLGTNGVSIVPLREQPSGSVSVLELYIIRKNENNTLLYPFESGIATLKKRVIMYLLDSIILCI